MAEVVAVNLAKRMALLDDGRVLPITDLFDHLGEETDSAFHATSFVAGEGRDWFSDAIAPYERQTTQ